MSQSIAILGRQPALGLAELESLYGAAALKPLGAQAVLIENEFDEISINRLGGTVKLAKALTFLSFTDWKKLSDYLIEHVPKHTCCIGPGKLTFGISTYGLKVSSKDIERTALAVKKAVRKSDNRPVRVVPTKGTELSSAQIIHNNMAELPFGMELLFIQVEDGVWLAQTVGIQDIEAYGARDQARPKRDAKVGMLPPKLAQIIINLAKPEPRALVLDPFCGTGVVLQEALLMGYPALGTDLEPRMVQYAEENLQWLASKFPINAEHHVTVGDATSYQWPANIGCMAGETYLGRPFSHKPASDVLRQVMADVNTIHRKFLKNVAEQTKAGFRLTIAVPAWKIGNDFQHLPTLDHLKELGYNRLSFKYAANEDLIYHREGQIVGRELVTLIRK